MFTFLALFRGFMEQHSYESELENYIVRNNPQTPADVDQLTKEFEQNSRRSFMSYHSN